MKEDKFSRINKKRKNPDKVEFHRRIMAYAKKKYKRFHHVKLIL